jgi:hypothetical protein
VDGRPEAVPNVPVEFTCDPTTHALTFHLHLQWTGFVELEPPAVIEYRVVVGEW